MAEDIIDLSSFITGLVIGGISMPGRQIYSESFPAREIAVDSFPGTVINLNCGLDLEVL